MIQRLICWLTSYKYKQDYEIKWPELPVYFLIYYTDDPIKGSFIVFIDCSIDLDWKRDDLCVEYAASNGFEDNIPKILNIASTLEAYVINWPNDLKLSAKRLLGESLVQAFKGDKLSAHEAIENANKFIIEKRIEVSRFWTLKACVVSSFCAICLGIISIWQCNYIIDLLGKTTYQLILAGSAGSLGALLSVIMRLNSFFFDASAERFLHNVEGVTRVIAGGISGILVGVLVKLGVFLPVFSQTNHLTTALCAAAMIAGASERLVPAIISKVESNGSIQEGAKK